MMKKFKTNKGITLVALVITIIVLLILAMVSISIVMNQGIITKSKDAADKYNQKAEEEQEELTFFERLLGQYSGTDEASGDGDGATVETITSEKINKVLSETKNTKLKDEYGNKIVVPAGFKIKVEPDTNNATHVTEGIVIQDKDNNEFVWIPVGNIKTSKEDTTGTPITLGRYVFKYDGTIDETLSQTAPDAQLKTNTSTTYYYKEGSIEGIAVDSNGKATKGYAKDINTFITSANNNGGYYLGRYEARTSTKRTASENALTTLTENKNDYVYNYVTQLQATERCQSMYTGKPFTSDLINSYAWDTAILFIQTFGENSNYANAHSVNTTSDGLAKKGTDSDKIRNIYDMASNCYEWSTETFSYSRGPCTLRGGYYCSDDYTCNRIDNHSAPGGPKVFSFRPLLYV